jgi:general stress protein 26
MSSTSTTEDRRHLLTIMKGFDTAMLVSRASGGKLRSRPMAVAEIHEDGTMLFSTAIDSPKVHEIESDPVVNVVMQGKTQFLSISGRARLVRDRSLIDRLWKADWKIWFPGGKDDPSLCLIAVDPSQAEFWDNAGTHGLKYLFEAARAYIKGEKPASDGDQNAKVRL